MVRIVSVGVLLRSNIAWMVLGRVAVEALLGIGKVVAHLRCAVLAHLLLVTGIGLRRH